MKVCLPRGHISSAVQLNILEFIPRQNFPQESWYHTEHCYTSSHCMFSTHRWGETSLDMTPVLTAPTSFQAFHMRNDGQLQMDHRGRLNFDQGGVNRWYLLFQVGIRSLVNTRTSVGLRMCWNTTTGCLLERSGKSCRK